MARRETTIINTAPAATELEELYRAMVELAPDGIVTTDAKGVVTSANTAITRMLGYTTDELVGRHFIKLDAFRLSDVPRYLKLFKDILNGKVGEPIEVVLHRQDKELVLADVRVNLLKIGGKTVIQANMRDITERRQMEQAIQEKNEQLEAQNEELNAINEELRATEEELRATNEELQATNEELREAQERLIRTEKLAAIGQLASGVGHELRNPLGAIKNAVFYIKRRLDKTDLPAAEPRVIEFLGIIDEEVASANKVITDLLSFSRVAKPTVSPVNVADIIEAAITHTPLPETITLVREIDRGLPPVIVDTDQIRQVFINIITNARQAMDDTGRLDIKTGRRNDYVAVSFIDTGGGIPKDVIKKIFDPLFTTKAKGIGLGLSVCQSILERHGGDIQVASKPGRGSTFTVLLPTQADDTTTPEGK